MRKLFLLLTLSLFLFSCDFSDETVDLNAKIFRTNTTIIIENNNDFNYQACSIAINSDYRYKVPLLRAHSKITLDLTSFHDSEGTRFNQYQTVIMSVSLYCDLADEQKGFFYGTFE